MKSFHGTLALLLCAQLALPSAASARPVGRDDGSMRPLPVSAPAIDAAAQGTTSRRQSSAGGKLLKSTLIGAAIGSLPSRGPSHPSRHRTAVGSTLTPRLKTVSVAVRF